MSDAILRVNARLVILGAVVAMTAGVSTGLLTAVPRAVRDVYAACGANYSCPGADVTATSALAVVHAKQVNPGTVVPVEPDTGETWYIGATWSTSVSEPGCSCRDVAWVGVNAAVNWSDGTGWSVNCTGCNPSAGPIRSVSICNTVSCGGDDDLDNGWGYKLLVDIDHTVDAICNDTSVDAFLSAVDYTTTSVDDGNLIDPARCIEGESVSPTSQTWNDDDTGAFECGVSCDNTGASVTILYD